VCSPRINAVDRIGARQQRCDRSRFSVLLTTRCLDVNEIIFVVEDSPEGGYLARALGVSIYTQADSAEVLHERVRGADRGQHRRTHREQPTAIGAILAHFEKHGAREKVRSRAAAI